MTKIKPWTLTLFALFSLCAAAKEPFSGTDYSAVYHCNGEDNHEGKYTGTVTLQLIAEQSTGELAFRFSLSV